MRDAVVDPAEAVDAPSLARPARTAALVAGRVVAYSWLMAVAAIGMLNLLHAELHEHHDLPALIHWLRDAALAVPLAAIAVLAAALVVLARTFGPRRAGGGSSIPSMAISLAALVPGALITGPPWRAVRPHTGPDQAPGSTLHASAGSSAFLATAGSTHAGGNR